MRKLAQGKARLAQSPSNRVQVCRGHNNVGINRVNWLDVTIHRQTANQAPGSRLVENRHYFSEIARAAVCHRFKTSVAVICRCKYGALSRATAVALVCDCN